MRLDLKSIGVILLCLFGAATSGFLLYRDITDQGKNGHGKALAQVIRAENRVKRKPASSYVWSSVQQDQSLFERESVQTGSNSTALVRLKDGTHVELRPNSLIMIDDSKDLASSFIRGSLIVHREDGSSLLTVSQDGKLTVQKLAVQLLQPAFEETFFVEQGSIADVRFEWKVRPDGAPSGAHPTLQLSTDAAFRSHQTLVESTLSLPPGTYHWRAMDGDESVSGAAQFRIVQAGLPVHTGPLAGDRIVFHGMTASVDFRWVNPKTIEDLPADSLAMITHEVEVSAFSDFRSIMVSKTVSAGVSSVRIEKLPAGSFFWRIRSRWKNFTVVTEHQPFQTEQAKKLVVDLLSPRPHSILAEKPLRLSWRAESVSEEIDFGVEIEPENRNGGSSRSAWIRGSAYTVNDLSPGAYRWRVRARIGEDIIGESGWKNFTIAQGAVLTLRTPYRGQRIHYWKEAPAFRFSWDQDILVRNDSSRAYILEVSATEDFQQPFTQLKTRDTVVRSSQLQIPPGSHHWRVRVVDENGETANASEILPFDLGLHPVLENPTHASPGPDTRINPLEGDPDPVLSWSRIESAESYEVLVTRESPQGEAWIRQTTRKTSIRLKNIPEGTYFWSIRAIDRLKRFGEALPPRKIIIDAGDILEAPKPLAAEVQ